jgi:5-methyltetrahydrofolate--homocysteine methyltransferase
MHIKRASDALTGKDHNSIHYIKTYGENKEAGNEKKQGDSVYNAILDGLTDDTLEGIKISLKKGATPNEIVNEHLIPAITRVGELYEKRTYFLPQLIQSGEAMQAAMKHLSPLLGGTGHETIKGRIVLATVKGDVHDIGKNIVGLMLKNYGFEVIDLGKDVPAEVIVGKAREIRADIIGLSALMTTTMVEMRQVIQKAREEKLNVKIIIGGAAVDEGFAMEIGADAYAKDAYMAVKQAESFVSCK